MYNVIRKVSRSSSMARLLVRDMPYSYWNLPYIVNMHQASNAWAVRSNRTGGTWISLLVVLPPSTPIDLAGGYLDSVFQVLAAETGHQRLKR
jgi:hypothetical protein